MNVNNLVSLFEKQNSPPSTAGDTTLALLEPLLTSNLVLLVCFHKYWRNEGNLQIPPEEDIFLMFNTCLDDIHDLTGGKVIPNA